MNIGLIDVDGRNYPSVPQMKISSWHKSQGDHVEWFSPLFEYDKVYMSKVFTFTDDYEFCIRAKEIIRGGTGYGLDNKLPDYIEKMYPDYSLYGITNTAYGFLTRGCPRKCSFCIVSEKEGCKSYKVADLEQFWKGQKEISLLDPNLLACKEHEELLKQLISSKAYVDFTQGIDARLLNPDNVRLLSMVKTKMIHFAWDSKTDDTIPYMLWHYKKATNVDIRKARVYVLANYDTEFDFDLYRVYRLKELGFDPYIMIYDKQQAPRQIKRLARWVNNKYIFRSCERFEDYK